jgi:16S rRNA U516 pseudouridylate synthase RsuA-like enzyme
VIPAQRTGPTTIPSWTRIGLREHRKRVVRAVTFYLGFRLSELNTAAVEARLVEARAECAVLRQRAQLGHDLAEAQQRARHVEGLLLAEEGYADDDTGPLRVPR